MQYLVTHVPKRKYRNSYSTAVIVVEAKSAAEAIRIAKSNNTSGEKYFEPDSDFEKTKAEPLTVGAVYLY